MSVFVDFEAYLLTVEFDRSVLVAALAQYLCKTVEGKDFFSEVAMACLDYFLGFLIGEASVGACNCARDTMGEHFGIIVHDKYAAECQFLFVGTQGAYAV